MSSRDILPSLPDVTEIPHDAVNHPAHYTAGGVECIDAIEAALTCQQDPCHAWLTGQVIKYLWRWPMKGGVEDLRKSEFYLKRLIGKIESADHRDRRRRG